MKTLPFGEYIKQIRRASRMGLREAAEAIGITPGHLSKIENGIAAPPKGESIHAMARCYGVPVSDLLSRASASDVVDTAGADDRMAPFVSAFYRLAAGRTRPEQLKMLRSAIEGLNLSPEDKVWWLKQVEAIASRDDLGLHRLGRGANDLFDLHAVPRRLTGQMIEDIAMRQLESFYDGNVANYSPPTAIDKLVEWSDDRIELTVFGDEISCRLDDGSPAVLGRCRWRDPETREIGVHEDLFDSVNPTDRRRANFTIAHEHFHAIEHLPRMKTRSADRGLLRPHEFVSVGGKTAASRRVLSSNEEWREWQANTYAAALLMPRFAVQRIFSEMFGPEAIIVSGGEIEEMSHRVAAHVEQNDTGLPQSLCDRFDVNPAAMAIRLRTLGLVSVD